MTSSRSIRTSIHSERGATLVEYALLIALIVLVCIGALIFVNKTQGDKFNKPSTSTTTTIQVVKPDYQKMVKTAYRGYGDLWCPASVVDANLSASGCDFIRFYNDHPDLVELDKIKQGGS